MRTSVSKTVLVAPLDWGLGHASRCMPIIDRLQQQGKAVHIAGNGASLQFLRDRYPQLPAHELPGYNIHYPVDKNASVQILLQSPRMFRTIQQEHREVEALVSEYQIDSILSDNRYGAWDKRCRNVLVCHQVAIQSPRGFSWMNPLFLKAHFRMMKNFDVLWIPDLPGEPNLSGKLSHGFSIPMPHEYIGPLSRFENIPPVTATDPVNKYRIVALLSGNEPQRTHFENLLRPQLQATGESCLLVQGTTDTKKWHTEGLLDAVTFLQAEELLPILLQADVVVCRSGYSTIMDLAALGKKAILVPTPGQTEQEYLADELARKKMTVSVRQEELKLGDALTRISGISGMERIMPVADLLQPALEKYL